MATSQAAKRLARILSNEDYGPKLARMNRRDEAYILQLIDENKGKKARSEIVRLDKERRERRRQRSRQPSYVIDKNVMRRRAADNIIRQVRGKPSTVKRNVEYMDDSDLTFAVDASRTDIIERAKRRAYITAPDIDYEINPFWYK